MASQKIPKKVVSSYRINDEGVAGLRRGESAITPVEYKMDTDGRLVFNQEGWKKFHKSEHLYIGQAVLINARTTNRKKLDVVVVFDTSTL